ncbi:MAG: thioredoxin-disulfide reductase [Ignavibacteria bacterium RBG_13_36_8]|nr:MAG: thioredoxin-disulfide reductase [Ignavibacteria bacterium RBG_13_36_8]
MADKIYDVIIIGSGPAALTAAIYTTRGNALTLIIGGEKWGGQLMLTTLVENFPGFPEGIQGPDLMMNMRKQAEKFGALFVEKNAVKVNLNLKAFEVTDNGGIVYKAKTIITTTGALTQWLNVPGEKELIGRGVATCAPCDAPFYKDKIVAVVGGGDSAMEEANVLTKYASKVYMIHRRDEFRASKAMQDKIFANKKIEIMWNTEVKEVKGEEKVKSLIIKNNKTNKEEELQLDGVFVAIGHKPDSDIFKGMLAMDEKGFVKNDFDKYYSATSVPGVFVAGDVMDKQYKQAITAAGMGCMAGMDVLTYLESEASK